MASVTELMSEILKQVENRYQFLKTDNALPAPTIENIELSSEDALAEINMFPPETSFTLINVMYGKDTRWKSLLILGTAKNVLRHHLLFWGANGYDSPIEELPLEDKYDRYKDMLDKLEDEFTNRLEKLKATSQKYALLAACSNSNPLLKEQFYWSGRWVQVAKG